MVLFGAWSTRCPQTALLKIGNKKMLKYLKENLLIATIIFAVVIMITLVVIFVLHVKTLDSNLVATWIGAVGSIISGLGAIVVAVFAWTTYRYATKQYLNNKLAKLQFEKKYQIITKLIKVVHDLKFEMKNIDETVVVFLIKPSPNELSEVRAEKIAEITLKISNALKKIINIKYEIECLSVFEDTKSLDEKAQNIYLDIEKFHLKILDKIGNDDVYDQTALDQGTQYFYAPQDYDDILTDIKRLGKDMLRHQSAIITQ